MQKEIMCSSCHGRGKGCLPAPHEDDPCTVCNGRGRVPYTGGVRNHLVTEQAPPKASTGPAVWPLVMKDFADRDAEGRRKYGVPLQPFNGRSAVVDAYQEALDLVVYLKQFQLEVASLREDLESMLPFLKVQCPAMEDALRGILARYKFLSE